MTGGGADPLHRSLIHFLHRAGQCAGDIFHAEMKVERLTPRQLAVLLTVAQNEGLRQTNLVERTGIDRSTLADIVRRLQRKGLPRRRRTQEDARARDMRVTQGNSGTKTQSTSRITRAWPASSRTSGDRARCRRNANRVSAPPPAPSTSMLPSLLRPIFHLAGVKWPSHSTGLAVPG
jgi:DNA-binding MarR family transcriptional regulator